VRDILAEIVAKKRDIVAAAKRSVPLDELKSPLSCGTFRMAEHFRWRGWGLIAECKLQSPAKGRLTTSHSVTELADIYTAAGATQASKKAMMRRYYTMPRYVQNYVGGYFWWYFVQDCASGAGPSASNGKNRGTRNKAKATDELLKSLSEAIGEAYR